MLELYGACAQIPDGNTKDHVLASLLDCYLDLWLCLFDFLINLEKFSKYIIILKLIKKTYKSI
jgi:hypothetical protein